MAAGQTKKNLISQMLGKEDRALSTTGWTEIETLAGEPAKVVMPAFGVGTADAGDALERVAAGTRPLPDLLDTLKAVHAIGGRVLRIVLLAELGEMPFKDGMEFVATTGEYTVWAQSSLKQLLCSH